MSRKRLQLPPDIAQGLNAAQQQEAQRKMEVLHAQKQLEQQQMVFRMFIAGTAKDLYVETIANYQDEITDEALYKFATGAQHASLILAQVLGFVEMKEE